MIIDPRFRKRAVTAYSNSKGSGEPGHPRSLTRTCHVRLRKQYAKGKFQPKNRLDLVRGLYIRTRSLIQQMIRKAFSRDATQFIIKLQVKLKIMLYITNDIFLYKTGRCC